jgi:hypothetical protein
MVDGATPRDDWADAEEEPRASEGGRVRSRLLRAALSGLAGALRAADVDPPRGDARYRWSLAGDVVSNASYYALVAAGQGRRPVLRGAALGLAAGLGAAFLPGPLGLGRQPGSRPPETPLLTVAWYTLAGLAAGTTFRALGPGRASDG